jgi:hypothetical protein
MLYLARCGVACLLISDLGSLREENCEFEARLGYTARLFLKNP